MVQINFEKEISSSPKLKMLGMKTDPERNEMTSTNAAEMTPIANLSAAEKRNLDKFYTKPEIVADCVQDIITYLNPEGQFIEPSAGNGVWLPHFDNIIGYDLAPDTENIIQQNFFDLDLTQYEDIHFVGNPPFADRLAERFIEKMSNNPTTKSISLVLPAILSKYNKHKCYNKYFHKLFEKDIPKDAFMDMSTGESKSVNCVFQIWVRKDIPRDTTPYDSLKDKPKGFTWCSPEKCDWAVCTKGSAVGKLCSPNWVNGTGKPVSQSRSYYFFKLDKEDKDFEVIWNTLSKGHMNCRNVGAPGVSKADLNREINKCILFSEVC